MSIASFRYIDLRTFGHCRSSSCTLNCKYKLNILLTRWSVKTYVVHKNFASVSMIRMISEICNEFLKLKQHFVEVFKPRSHGIVMRFDACQEYLREEVEECHRHETVTYSLCYGNLANDLSNMLPLVNLKQYVVLREDTMFRWAQSQICYLQFNLGLEGISQCERILFQSGSSNNMADECPKTWMPNRLGSKCRNTKVVLNVRR